VAVTQSTEIQAVSYSLEFAFPITLPNPHHRIHEVQRLLIGCHLDTRDWEQCQKMGF